MYTRKTPKTLLVMISFTLLLMLFSNVVVLAQGPDPTPVPPSDFGKATSKGVVPSGIPLASGESYYSNAYFTSGGGQTAHYGSGSRASGTNSLQVWSEVTYRGRYGSTWYWLDNLWNSTWGSSVYAGSSQGLGGEVTLHTHGTHLFDYGSGNWVWHYSDKYENSW